MKSNRGVDLGRRLAAVVDSEVVVDLGCRIEISTWECRLLMSTFDVELVVYLYVLFGVSA